MEKYQIPGEVLVTGGLGFLGREISRAFCESGWMVSSLGKSRANDLVFDLSKEEPIFDKIEFRRVVHIAGMAHRVNQINDAVQSFFDINAGGTRNLLLALDQESDAIRQFVYISTVAVYGQEMGRMLDEKIPLEGRGPYAQSKIQAEEMVQEWGQKNGVPTLILRLPFVAGHGAPGEFQQLLDRMRTSSFRIIGNGAARRSALHVTDLASHITGWEEIDGIYNLTDGYHPTFAEWYDFANRNQDSRQRQHMPDWAARILSGMGDLIPGFPYHSRLYYQLSSELTFSDQKARQELGWSPKPVIDYQT
jgi:GlcNAc-P-P-Und epimerase